MSLPALSEADVRLRLYPSSGRVVKVTEGHWPSLRESADDFRRTNNPTAYPVDPDVALAMGLPCDCPVCQPGASPARTRPEGEPDGNR